MIKYDKYRVSVHIKYRESVDSDWVNIKYRVYWVHIVSKYSKYKVSVHSKYKESVDRDWTRGTGFCWLLRRLNAMCMCVQMHANILERTSVLQCVAVCCSVLQCVAVCCSVLQCVAVCCSVLQCVAVCCSVLQCWEIQRVAVCCSVLQSAADCCNELQWAAVCRSVLLHRVISIFTYRHLHTHTFIAERTSFLMYDYANLVCMRIFSCELVYACTCVPVHV